MTPIEKAYREGFNDCERDDTDIDDGWFASCACEDEDQDPFEILRQLHEAGVLMSVDQFVDDGDDQWCVLVETEDGPRGMVGDTLLEAAGFAAGVLG